MRTLGQFYRENVAGRPDLVIRELPPSDGESAAERDLFGWKLRIGKRTFECRSEEEARFLKIFLNSGLQELGVPQDDAFIRSILPELENLKTKIDKIINDYLNPILDVKVRERVRHRVLEEINS